MVVDGCIANSRCCWLYLRSMHGLSLIREQTTAPSRRLQFLMAVCPPLAVSSLSIDSPWNLTDTCESLIPKLSPDAYCFSRQMWSDSTKNERAVSRRRTAAVRSKTSSQQLPSSNQRTLERGADGWSLYDIAANDHLFHCIG